MTATKKDAMLNDHELDKVTGGGMTVITPGDTDKIKELLKKAGSTVRDTKTPVTFPTIPAGSSIDLKTIRTFRAF